MLQIILSPNCTVDHRSDVAPKLESVRDPELTLATSARDSSPAQHDMISQCVHSACTLAAAASPQIIAVSLFQIPWGFAFVLTVETIAISALTVSLAELAMAMMMPSVEVRNAIAVVVMSVVAYVVTKVVWIGLWEPLRLRRIMAKQGVRGPAFRFLTGNFLDAVSFGTSFPEPLPLDDFANLSPTVTPQYAMYFPKYGRLFVYEWGTTTRCVVRDPAMAKELLVTNHDSLMRAPIEDVIVSEIIGKGLLTLKGKKWVNERRTLSTFFHQDSLKGMVESMVEGAATEMKKWEQAVGEAGGLVEIDVDPHIHNISGNILSRTAFGDDFDKGNQIFKLQTALAEELLKTLRSPGFWLLPGYRRLPTEGNRLMDQYISKIDALLHGAINGRREAMQNGESSSHGNDLLGRMLTAASEGWDENSQEFNLASVLNNCKLFYFAGQDTVANATNWAMLMLALHPEWQDRARQEVLAAVDDEAHFDASAVSHLKVVGMVLNETLRIFPPAAGLTRVATKDLQLKSVFIPKGLTIEIPITALHQDKEYWGDDVGEFRPERFANGISGACTHSQAFIPFGLGPKLCIANNFALMEAKVVLSMVLRRFQLLPSPNYKHHPIFKMSHQPMYGMPIILKAL